MAVSPDGRDIVYSAIVEGRTQLWLRPLASDTARPLAGTDGAAFPFWSPDSRSIGFVADQKLKRLDIGGDSVRTLADTLDFFDASWGDGAIVFAPANSAPLYRIPANGGERPVEVTSVQRPRQTGHRRPRFLPDGRRFLFFAVGESDVQGVYLGSLDSPETQRLLDADTAAVFVPPDFLLFGRAGALYAQRFDLRASRMLGDLWALPLEGTRTPFPVAQTALAEDGGRFSPDGGWILYQSNETGRVEIFVQAFPGPGRSWQISTGGGIAARWRSDGREILYRTPDNRIMAVPVTLNPSNANVNVGTPVALFSLRSGSTFDVTRDGQRFLVNAPRGEAVTPPITVVLNWRPPAP